MSARRLYPAQPLVGVGALIRRGTKVLLIRRGTDPGKGKWSIPGGLVETGEDIESAAKREVREEVGLAVEVTGFIDVFENIVRDPDGRVKFHYVIIDYFAKPIGGRMKTSDEVEAAGWFTPSEAWKLDLTTTTMKLLEVVDFIPKTSRNQF